MDSRDEFIREITLRICSSLEIKESLRNTFEYLSVHIPLNVLALFIIDERLGAMRRIAHAHGVDAVPLDEIIPLPKGMPEKIAAKNFSTPFVIDTEDDEIFRILAPLAKFKGNTDMVVPLRINDGLLGGLILRAAGEGRYNDEQAQLLGFIAKPFTIALANALAHEEVLRYQATLLDDKRFLSRELYRHSEDEIIGGKTGLRNVMEMVHQVAPLNNTVLILGETGTGKELIANAIHFSSQRKDGPFIKVNCGALPENLVDSELFGHEKGAFTGALAENRGRFERANGGTIFLDEIGELPPMAQVRLLRVLQFREIERIGGNKAIKVDTRVIAATHRNLQNMIAGGSFREDLWFRLNTFPIIVPPVRQRKEDIPALTRYFVEAKSRELGMPLPPSIAPGALLRLINYNWPGNVRELENLVERELIRYRGGTLNFDTFFSNGDVPHTNKENITFPPLSLNEAIASHISSVLKITNGKIHGPGGAAELLKVNPNTLRWRVNKLGISYKREKSGNSL